MTTAMTPAPPVVFSELTTTELCKWCQSDIATDGCGFIICPHCDRACSQEDCARCDLVNVQTELTEAELETAALPPPEGHYWWPRRWWQALCRRLPWPPEGWYFEDDSEAA